MSDDHSTKSFCKHCGGLTKKDRRRNKPYAFCSKKCRLLCRSPLLDRFVLKTKKAKSGCIEWQGSKVEGYGQIMVVLRCTPSLAHRVSYELFVGPIPESLWVLHHCDNRACVRPDHLFLGNHQANIDDCVSKGRNAKGDKHGRRKLSAKDIPEIRKRVDAGESLRSVGNDFGISKENTGEIARRELWKHVPETKESK